MKHITRGKRTLARLWGVVAVLGLISASCAPVPVAPSGPTPAANTPLPYAGNPQPDASPLEAATALASPQSTSAGSPATPPVASETVQPSPTPLPSLAGPVWQWVSSSFSDGTTLAPGDPTRYTFQLLGDGNAIVQADCNFGTGTYEVAGNVFSFSGIGTTKVACPPDSLDSAFLAQLRNVESFELDGAEAVLALKESAGKMRLRSVPGETAEGNTESLPTATSTEASAPPSPTATETASPTPLPVPSPTPLPVASPTPLPTATPTALPVVLATPVLVGTPLPTPVQALAGAVPVPRRTNWVLTGLVRDSQATAPDSVPVASLEVGEDGQGIAGSTGCNRYRAKLSQDASGKAVLGFALTTGNTCAANLVVQEAEFIGALLSAQGYTVQRDTLTFVDSAAKDLLVFARK